MTTQSWNDTRGSITDSLVGFTGGNLDAVKDDTSATLRRVFAQAECSYAFERYSDEELDRWLDEYRAGTITVPVGR